MDTITKLQTKIDILDNLTATTNFTSTQIYYKFCVGCFVYYLNDNSKYVKRRVQSRRYYKGNIFYKLDDLTEHEESILKTSNQIRELLT